METNKKTLPLFAIYIIAFMILAVGGILYFENIRSNGVEVILMTEPVDPRSLLRWDYVILNYEIGSITKDEHERFFQGMDTKKKIKIYTTLTLDSSHRVVEYEHTTTKPTNGIYLTGSIERDSDMDDWRFDTRIDYGIGQYFVPEGKGWTIERIGRWGERQDDTLEVSLSVSSNGIAQIQELLISGQPVDFNTIESENPYVR